MKGTIFDIKEFAINDGPGIRITVFMKGCPLHCLWCHNPEGILPAPQKNFKTGCITGKEYTVKELVAKVKKFKDVFDISNGGVTFSGGEPTMQAEFIYECAKSLPDIHKTLDTSGYCIPKTFSKLIEAFNLVFFDLKIVQEEQHIHYTGQSNRQILENLKILSGKNIPYHIRIPLIPDITDTKENLDNILKVILSLKNKPLRVDPLPYNILAGGKYETYGMEYPLKNSNNVNNLEYINEFKNSLIENNIKIIGDEVKCLQKI